MADSDGEYVDNASSDEYEDHHVTHERGEDQQHQHGARGARHAGAEGGASMGGGVGTRRGYRAAAAAAASANGGRGPRRRRERREQQAAWETVKRSWDTVGETGDGQVIGVELLEAAEKRRRVLRDTTPLQRGIIRHVVLVLDMSAAMASRDFLPTCQRVALSCAAEFVAAFFEQNPISQLTILAMRDGVCVRVSDMGGNPAEHLERLAAWDTIEPQGAPSLQNALEMCRGALFHSPAHGTREVLIVFGALLSSDPGDIHDTIAALVTDRIRVRIVGLAAQVAICSEICARTNAGDDRSSYEVALHDVHFRELFLAVTTPPATQAPAANAGTASGGNTSDQASLLMMGFPSRATADAGTLSVCACHNRPVREGYTCTRCSTKVCRLPAECPACGLTLILSTHLARSYHHLFPLRNWVEVSWPEAAAAVRHRAATACQACLTVFPDIPPPDRLRGMEVAMATTTAATAVATMGKRTGTGNGTRAGTTGANTAAGAGSATAGGNSVAKELRGVSESGRYKCEVCGNHFCIDCDVFAHEVIHNCPGCLSDTRPPEAIDAEARAAKAVEGNGAKSSSEWTDEGPREAAVAAVAPKPKTKILLKSKTTAAAKSSTGTGGEMILD